jgi:hypothetical protein
LILYWKSMALNEIKFQQPDECVLIRVGKRFSSLVVLMIPLICSGQNPTGKYIDNFGHTLELNKDNTFTIDWRFDLSKTWSSGKWHISNDTIQLKFISIYDTLVRNNRPDSLVLSDNATPSKVNETEFAIRCISSISQRADITNRLYLRRDRLYLVDKNGRLDKQKVPGIMGRKNYSTSYTKLK